MSHGTKALTPDRAYLSTLTVLHVEDDAQSRAHLGPFLRRRVAEALEAADGQEGLRLFRERAPDIVLTDIRMAPLDGLAMIAALRAQAPDVPVIVTTAFEQVDFLERAIEVGVDAFIPKPIDGDRLEAALEAAARRLRTAAERRAAQDREMSGLRVRHREAIALLAGGVAHDLNNLLQAIVGNLDCLPASARLDPESADILKEVRDASRQAVEIGRRLQTLSESMPLALAPHPLGAVLEPAVRMGLGGANVSVVWDVEAELPEVACDRHLLRQAILQLVRNAAEAMPEGGELKVRVRRLSEPQGSRLRIELADTGGGIAPQVLPRIFDPYFTTKPRGGVRGLGLGLALARAIVHRHRGRIAAASTAAGTTLTVTLPLVEPDATGRALLPSDTIGD